MTPVSPRFVGAADRIRTGDVQLGKSVSLSILCLGLAGALSGQESAFRALLPTFCQKRCQKLRRLSGPAPEKASRPLPATPRRLVLVESGVTPVDRRADLCRPPRQPGQPKFPRSPAGKPRGALRSGRDARGHGIRTRV